jgi:regulator of protease activity HflC (stomatin/prohibitin superfamily)
MLVVLVCFVVSGVFIVDEKEVVVRMTFGKPQEGPPCRPGFHWGLPYPIDEIVRVSTAPKNMRVEDFWLRLREEDKTKSLDQLGARGTGLDPAVDGALLTGDKAIMHASFKVQYKIPETSAKEYVRNVQNEEVLLRSVIKQAAIAEAARIPATVIWRDPASLATAVMSRAQKHLDQLETGIQLENVAAPDSHYPLQTSSEFLAVNNAENRQRATINEANTERENKLNGVAGLAWQKISTEIEKFDQVKESERQAIFKAIGELLLTQAMGEAGGKVQLARRDREQIVNDTLAEVSQFDALREEYHRNPDLMRLRLNQMMRDRLFANNGLVKWILPPDDKNIVLWMAKDPKESADEARRRMEEATKKK